MWCCNIFHSKDIKKGLLENPRIRNFFKKEKSDNFVACGLENLFTFLPTITFFFAKITFSSHFWVGLFGTFDGSKYK